MRVLMNAVAMLGIVFGCIAALVAVWAWFDPAGMQLANDADPFGTPPGRHETAFLFAFGMFVAIASAGILRNGCDEDEMDGSGDEEP